MWGMYIWNITEPYKEGNNTICSNMDGPRDEHTKQSKSDRKNITQKKSQDITHTWNLKK